MDALAVEAMHRPPRLWPPAPTSEPLTLSNPPALPEPEAGSGWQLLMPLLGGLGMLGMAVISGRMLFLVLAVALSGASLAFSLAARRGQRASSARKQQAQRSRWLTHLQEVEGRAAAAADRQREWLNRRFPDAVGLVGLLSSQPRAVWERRPDCPDAGWVAIGSGPVPALVPVRLSGGDGTALSAADPELARRARAAESRSAQVEAAAVTVHLGPGAGLAVAGPQQQASRLLGAVLGQLVAFHPPQELALVALLPADGTARAAWRWLDFLPHTICEDSSGLRRAERRIACDPAHAQALLAEVEPGRRRVLLMATCGPGTPESAFAAAALATDPDLALLCSVPTSADAPAGCGATATVDSTGRAQLVESGSGGRVLTGISADLADPEVLLRLARRLAPLRCGPAASRRPVQDLRLSDLPAGRPLRAWLGVTSDGEPLQLDLREAAQGGDGPHGLLIGATGSGKSELLRTVVTGLVAAAGPDQLSLVLADYKGGAAFDGLADLPHVAGTITNLATDPALVQRASTALAAELRHRQHVLRRAGADSVAGLNRQRPGSLPSLLLVVDEAGELIAAHPEVLDVFGQVGRLGRSLGVHLLLSTQRLEEGRLRSLEAHLRYRLCLRTFTAEESRAVLGGPQAHQLPAAPGHGYLSVDSRLTRFRAARVSLPRRSTTARSAPARTVSALPRPPSVVSSARESGASELQEVVASIHAQQHSGTRPVWLPPLPHRVAPAGPAPSTGCRWDELVLGLVDLPEDQEQPAWQVDLTAEAGHVAVVGGPRTGVTSALRSLATSMCSRSSPDRLHLVVLDGGGGLADLDALPHVRVLTGPADPGTLARALRLVQTEAAAARTDGPDLLVLIDDVATLRGCLPDLDQVLAAAATDGLARRLHLAVGARRWLDLRPALLDAVGTRIELRLNDPADSLLDRRLAATLPRGVPGRCLVRVRRDPEGPPTPAVAQLALADTEHLRSAARRWPGSAARRLPVLPAVVDAGKLPVGDAHVLGLREDDGLPAELDLLVAGRHLLVLGDAGSGRTSALRRLLGWLLTRGDADVHVLDPRRGLLDLVDGLPYAHTDTGAAALLAGLLPVLESRRPDESLSRQQLLRRDWWTGREQVLLVDDLDHLAPGCLTALAELLPVADDVGLHVVAGRRVSGVSRAMFDPLLTRLREASPVTLLLSGDPREGPVVAGRAATVLPPGRGLLVEPGADPVTVQLALDVGRASLRLTGSRAA